MAKAAKRYADQEQDALVRMQVVHQTWMQHRGYPQDQQQWKAWHDYFISNNYSEELIKSFYKRLAAEAQAAQGSAPSGAQSSQGAQPSQGAQRAKQKSPKSPKSPRGPRR
mmetsp:Transcript_13248/g.39483  ORF Transcript_13248/g.39483 Transcript_13248/m.39483 type:complete len:110 (-) Transcript_13248:13-342(-)